MMVVAHRGFHESAPENTLAAFEAAVALGVDGIETDVRLDARGVPILFHDRFLADGRAVSDTTRDEIAHAFGFDVPTLDEALGAFDVFWDVEIKSPGAFEPMLAVLRRFRASRRLLVTSFRPALVERLVRVGGFECGAILGHAPAGAAWTGDPRVSALVWDHELVVDVAFRAAAERGFRNFVYGLRTREDHDRCRALGAAGVITDDPRLA